MVECRDDQGHDIYTAYEKYVETLLDKLGDEERFLEWYQDIGEYELGEHSGIVCLRLDRRGRRLSVGMKMLGETLGKGKFRNSV